MKLKDILIRSEVKHPKHLQNFEDFNNKNISEDSVEVKKDDKAQQKKKQKKILPYNKLSLKQREKIIKNMNHFLNGKSEYPV